MRAVQDKGEKPVKVLHLEVAREGNRLKISAQERLKGEQSTILHYEEKPVSVDLVNRRCLEVVETLNKANRRGRFTRQVLLKLRETGQIFHDELFSLNVKDKLNRTEAKHLCLSLDEQLVHIPWELLNDGESFLCQRFSMGRLVRTRQSIPGSRGRALSQPLKMLILADPSGDLEGAYAEGTRLRDDMDRRKDVIEVTLRSDRIDADTIKEKIRAFDIVHFAGHAEYHTENPAESGWRVSDRVLSTGDIMKMAGTGTMPALIFSNACQSARTEEWVLGNRFHDDIFGLANVFLLVGVKHYVGTFWEILDEPSSHYAVEFYKGLIAGIPVGEAVREARIALIKQYGEETILWASYLLYGDPAYNYMEEIEAKRPEEDEKPTSVHEPIPEVRTRDEVIDFAQRREVKTGRRWWGMAVGIALLVTVSLWVYPGLFRTTTEKQEKEALNYYQAGQFDEALMSSKALMQKSPGLCVPYLIQANILLRKGDVDESEAAFQKAWQADRATVLQKAEAMMGLGRVASLRRDRDKALECYRKATDMAPGSKSGCLSQALLLEDKGDYGGALSLFEKAYAMEPQDSAVAGMANETRKRVAIKDDQGKQERINTLVKELLESMKSPPRALPWDGWTSLPLTLWILDFETQGYSVQEGEERLLAAGISEQLLQKSRVQLMERQLLERLLEELKLGASNLADRTTALAVGKLLAARLILFGRIAYSDPQTQVSLRLIETETGRISAAMNEAFGSFVPVSSLSERLSKELLEKVSKLYPLRGKISEIRDGGIILNIGQNAGVVVGEKFKAIDEKVVFEVTSVQSDSCLARVTEGEQVPQKEMRVEALEKTP